MKNVIIAAVLLILTLFVFIKAEDNETTYLRIHILSNSCSERDENVKFSVKEKLCSLLTPLMANVSSVEEAKDITESSLPSLQNKISTFLNNQGYEYGAELEVNNEFFPTRSYEGYVVESGFYDALIVKLGVAKGDNWWCVIYPPLCFLNSSQGNVVLKSRLKQMIEKFFNNKESV